MKKSIFLLCALATLMISCSKQPEVIEKITVFKTYNEHHFYKLNLPDSLKWDSQDVYSEVKIFLQWPLKINGIEVPELQKELTSAIFANTTNIDSCITKILKAPVFFEDNPEVTQQKVDSIPELGRSTFYSKALKPTYLGERLYSFAVESADYQGGAHGFYGTSYIVYDIDKNKIVKLDDLFTDKTALVGMIVNQIKADFEEEDSCIDYNLIKETDNFFIDDSSIVFQYNPYEIACYAQGEVKARLDFYNFFGKDCLTPYAKELFKIDE